MIDATEFRAAWVLLCERFNREASDLLMQAYYDDLSPEMDTESFKAACRHVFRHREFFPRPADFLEAGKPDVNAEALAQWETVQQVMSGNDEPYHSLNPEAKRVIKLIGGVGTLRNTDLDRIPFVRREFFELYGRAAEVARREAKLLPYSTAETQRLAAGVKSLEAA